jgi:hypothetical protein
MESQGVGYFNGICLPPSCLNKKHDFFTLIEHVQSLTNLFDKDMDIHHAFGILRSMPPAFTSHAKKHGFTGGMDQYDA